MLTACGEGEAPGAGASRTPGSTPSDIGAAGAEPRATIEATFSTYSPPEPTLTFPGVAVTFDIKHTRDVDSARIRIVGPTIGETEFGALIGMRSHYPAGRARYTATATVVGTDDAKHELRTAGTLTLSEGTKVTITVSTRSLKVRNS
jgi:hypothetical protein